LVKNRKQKGNIEAFYVEILVQGAAVQHSRCQLCMPQKAGGRFGFIAPAGAK